MMKELADPASQIDNAVITVRFLQLFSENYRFRQTNGQNLRISMMAPVYFRNEVEKGQWREFFLTNYTLSDIVVCPILTGMHFVLTVKRSVRGNAMHVDCDFYDSFMHDADASVKDKLKFIAKQLHPSLKFVHRNFSHESDEQPDHVNCGTFSVENFIAYYQHGKVVKTIFSGFEKRMRLLKEIALLVPFEFDENEVLTKI